MKNAAAAEAKIEMPEQGKLAAKPRKSRPTRRSRRRGSPEYAEIRDGTPMAYIVRQTKFSWTMNILFAIGAQNFHSP
jgi:hypothetical protein